MTLLDALPIGSLVGLDTPPLIYFVEGHAQYGPIVLPLFRDRFDLALNRGITSPISLAEALIVPLRLGRNDLIQRHRDLLTTSSNLRLVDITASVAERAAELRAQLNLRLPDALQVAAAIEHGATHFITNDPAFKKVAGLSVIILKDYLPPAKP